MSATQPETLDLSILEGITTYVERILCTDIKRLYGMGRKLVPFGVALGTLRNGTALPRPQVMVASTVPAPTLRVTKRATRLLAKNSKATGIILAHLAHLEKCQSTREDDMVVVQLEHKEFGDLVWMALVSADGKLGEFSATSLEDASHDLKRTELLPGRWMH